MGLEPLLLPRDHSKSWLWPGKAAGFDNQVNNWELGARVPMGTGTGSAPPALGGAFVVWFPSLPWAGVWQCPAELAAAAAAPPLLQPGASLIPSLQAAPGISQVPSPPQHPKPRKLLLEQNKHLKTQHPLLRCQPLGPGVTPCQTRPAQGGRGVPRLELHPLPLQPQILLTAPRDWGRNTQIDVLVEQHLQGVGKEAGGGSRTQVSEDWGCRHPW